MIPALSGRRSRGRCCPWTRRSTGRFQRYCRCWTPCQRTARFWCSTHRSGAGGTQERPCCKAGPGPGRTAAPPCPTQGKCGTRPSPISGRLGPGQRHAWPTRRPWCASSRRWQPWHIFPRVVARVNRPSMSGLTSIGRWRRLQHSVDSSTTCRAAEALARSLEDQRRLGWNYTHSTDALLLDDGRPSASHCRWPACLRHRRGPMGRWASRSRQILIWARSTTAWAINGRRLISSGRMWRR